MNTRTGNIELNGLPIEILYKDIKNVHLSVHPPIGRVTVSAPFDMNPDTVRLFCISKLGWIRKQQAKLLGQERESPRQYLNRESHYFLGERYLLKIVERDAVPSVSLKHGTLELHVRPGSTREQKDEILQAWYRERLREIALPIVSKLEAMMKVKASELRIRTMKTRWGTCSTESKRIWLNTELAKKSAECIEYVVTHEMVHLLERNHNQQFLAHMDSLIPNWKHVRGELNRLALGYGGWEC
jgi:predicted metal-dependent hydrolase